MVKKKKKVDRLRETLRVWLNPKNEYDRFIMSIVKDFKSEREFTRTIRQGLHLIWDLRQGRVDFLLTMFPNIIELLELKLTPPPVATDTSKIEAKIDRLEQAFLASGQGRAAEALPARALPERPTTNGVDLLPVAADNDSSQAFLDDLLAM